MVVVLVYAFAYLWAMPCRIGVLVFLQSKNSFKLKNVSKDVFLDFYFYF
jgi:hypothetical protein